MSADFRMFLQILLSHTVILIYRLDITMTLCDIIMTLSVNIRSSTGIIKCHPAECQERNLESNPRGEVTMTPKLEGEKCNDPHETMEEKERKNRLFESYLRERVL